MDVKRELDQSGFILIDNSTESALADVMSSLGDVMLVTEVEVNTNSRSLVTSDKELDVHTDHNKANYIAWYCLKQTDIGGDSILVDGNEVLKKLTNKEKDDLSRLNLFEHNIFDDDTSHFPLLSSKEGRFQIYYSFWLVNNEDRNNKSFISFRKLVDESERIVMKLNPTDVLIVDNHRMLHGRSSIEGSKKRHLRRFWIKKRKRD